MTIFTKMEHLSVKDAMRLSFHQKTSLMQDVDGQDFDASFANVIERIPDPDGMRTEIQVRQTVADI